MGTRSDLRLYEQAMNQRWPIKPEYRKLMVDQAVMTLADPHSTKREKAAASRVLLAAESQNQQDEQKEKDDRLQQIIELAARFGIAREDIAAASIEGTASQADRPRLAESDDGAGA